MFRMTAFRGTVAACLFSPLAALSSPITVVEPAPGELDGVRITAYTTKTGRTCNVHSESTAHSVRIVGPRGVIATFMFDDDGDVISTTSGDHTAAIQYSGAGASKVVVGKTFDGKFVPQARSAAQLAKPVRSTPFSHATVVQLLCDNSLPKFLSPDDDDYQAWFYVETWQPWADDILGIDWNSIQRTLPRECEPFVQDCKEECDHSGDIGFFECGGFGLAASVMGTPVAGGLIGLACTGAVVWGKQECKERCVTHSRCPW